jgi:ABC-type microcin C transport system duplicated ATPase subunit YejF
MNIAVEWLVLLSHVLKASGLNPDSKTRHPDMFCGGSQSSQASARIIPLVWRDFNHFFPYPFQFMFY